MPGFLQVDPGLFDTNPQVAKLDVIFEFALVQLLLGLVPLGLLLCKPAVDLLAVKLDKQVSRFHLGAFIGQSRDLEVP